jgi:hypothetical protein
MEADMKKNASCVRKQPKEQGYHDDDDDDNL